MFEDLIKMPNNPEVKQQRANLQAEDRERRFQKEQGLFMSEAHPDSDRNYQELQDRKSDLIRWQQELDEELLDLILSFRGMRMDENGKAMPITDGKNNPISPLCNELFIRQVVVPIFKPILSKNSINTNFDEKQILDTQRYTADAVADMMADNHDKYGIDFINFDGIIRSLKNVMRPSVWRAYKGFTKKTDSSSIKRIESESFNQGDEQKKGFNKLFSSS